jgi:hypothetical protein
VGCIIAIDSYLYLIHEGSIYRCCNTQDCETSGHNVSSNDDAILKEAYQVLKQRQRAPPKGGYPFPRNDNVMTKLGHAPPSPCKVCGSKNHWDKECPDFNTFLETRKSSIGMSLRCLRVFMRRPEKLLAP